MRIFVTGASGYIGSAVVPELLQAGHEVVGLARSDESAAKVAALGAEVRARGGLADLDGLRTAASTPTRSCTSPSTTPRCWPAASPAPPRRTWPPFVHSARRSPARQDALSASASAAPATHSANAAFAANPVRRTNLWIYLAGCARHLRGHRERSPTVDATSTASSRR